MNEKKTGGEIMLGNKTIACCYCFFLVVFFILRAGQIVVGNSIQTDKEVLLQLKSTLLASNILQQGKFVEWNENSSSPCVWPLISCNGDRRVTQIDFSNQNINGMIFQNFSALSELSYLDLSMNSISGEIPTDLSQCKNLRYLNLSRNLFGGKLNLIGLNKLENLDLSVNRLDGEIPLNFATICGNLTTLKISSNRFSGSIHNCFDKCKNLQYLDLSSNNFSGQLWRGIGILREFSVSENSISGKISSKIFSETCNLKVLDLSGNHFHGEVPKEISNCKALRSLALWENNFSGVIPLEIGTLLSLEVLALGGNNFSREIPESLLNCSSLVFLDLSKNGFRGEIQEVFGRFVHVKFLILHGNSYIGGLHSSGIMTLPNIYHLDLSFNNFSGQLPAEISKMLSLKYLILAHNQFSGTIPMEVGYLLNLQALDLSYNRLTGSIPPTIGKLNSLLWLMLANNSLTQEIPPEIGTCGSLLWLNLANNQLSGKVPPQLWNIGQNATSTFQFNRLNPDIPANFGKCSTLRRWIPPSPPFSYVYNYLSWMSCTSIWNRLLKGEGLFPVCSSDSLVWKQGMSGYILLNGNQLSGEVSKTIGLTQNFSFLHLGSNEFSGKLPSEIGKLPLVFLDVSHNRFSGEIPSELGQLKCLQNLDLSNNNFSGVLPDSLNLLSDLNKFNISYNPLIYGNIPITGQLATFDSESFLGNPLLHGPEITHDTKTSSVGDSKPREEEPEKPINMIAFFVGFIASVIPTIVFFGCAKRSCFPWAIEIRQIPCGPARRRRTRR